MKQDALLVTYPYRVKYPYRCKHCHWLYLFNYHDIMRLADMMGYLPCTHNWLELEKGETAPEEKRFL